MNYIFTDGAARANGKPHCAATAAIWFNEKGDTRVITDKPSNQRAELVAIEMALQLATAELQDKPVTIVTDSLYAIKCLTAWHVAWEKNGWTTANKKPVHHQDLLRPCLDMIQRHGNVQFRHQRSHQPRPSGTDTFETYLWQGNDTVDRLAGEALRQIR